MKKLDNLKYITNDKKNKTEKKQKRKETI